MNRGCPKLTFGRLILFFQGRHECSMMLFVGKTAPDGHYEQPIPQSKKKIPPSFEKGAKIKYVRE